MKNKKGFISMAVVYSFLIIFLIIMLSLLRSFSNRNTFIDSIIDDVRIELNERARL